MAVGVDRLSPNLHHEHPRLITEPFLSARPCLLSNTRSGRRIIVSQRLTKA